MDYPVKNIESGDGGAPVLDRTIPGSLIQVLKACLIDGFNLQPVASLDMAANGENGRAEFAGNHGFRVHQVVEISGASGAAWNGRHRVTATGNQWIEFEIEGQPIAESDAGIEIKAAPVGGWEMPLISTDETRAAFRSTDPESTGMYWYLDDRRSADTEDSPATSTDLDWRFMRGVEDMADIDTRTNDFGYGWVFVGTSRRGNVIPYDIIADSRTVYLVTNPIAYGGYEYRSVHAFGDFVSAVPGDPYGAFLVLGRYASTTDYSGANCSNWGELGSTASKRIARAFDGVSRSLQASMRGHQRSGFIGSDGYAYPNPANLELLAHSPILIHESDSVMRGQVPGIAQPLHAAPLAHRGVVDLSGRSYKAITHARTDTTMPDPGQTFFDIAGPWR